MSFANPQYLWLFLVFIPLIVWYIIKNKGANPTLLVSTTMPFDKMPTSWKIYLRHIMFAVKLLAIACLIIILCRPQTRDRWQTS
ncbi:MAG: BatA domain-containing protein, partial [Muribaculaceae bacterium]